MRSSFTLSKITFLIGSFHAIRLLNGPINVLFLFERNFSLADIANFQATFAIFGIIILPLSLYLHHFFSSSLSFGEGFLQSSLHAYSISFIISGFYK